MTKRRDKDEERQIKKQEKIDKTYYLIKNLNTKLRKAKKNNNEYADFLQNKIDRALYLYEQRSLQKFNTSIQNDNGTIKQSKKVLENFDLKALDKIFNSLNSIQNNKSFGTERKYKVHKEIQEEKSIKGIIHTVGVDQYNKILESYGGDKKAFLKDFFKKMEEGRQREGKYYDSGTTLDEMYEESVKKLEYEKEVTGAFSQLQYKAKTKEEFDRLEVIR